LNFNVCVIKILTPYSTSEKEEKSQNPEYHKEESMKTVMVTLVLGFKERMACHQELFLCFEKKTSITPGNVAANITVTPLPFLKYLQQ
jgi:hypothetical protein